MATGIVNPVGQITEQGRETRLHFLDVRLNPNDAATPNPQWYLFEDPEEFTPSVSFDETSITTIRKVVKATSTRSGKEATGISFTTKAGDPATALLNKLYFGELDGTDIQRQYCEVKVDEDYEFVAGTITLANVKVVGAGGAGAAPGTDIYTVDLSMTGAKTDITDFDYATMTITP